MTLNEFKNKFTLCTAEKDLNHFKAKKKSRLKNHFGKLPQIETKKGNEASTAVDNVVSDGIRVVLPTVDFCEPAENHSNDVLLDRGGQFYPHISDLCEYDREKIGHLIAEIVRQKEARRKKSAELKKFVEENRRKNEKIIQLEQDLAAFKLGCKAKDKDVKFLSEAHKIQETALKKQVLDFQRNIMTMTKEKLNFEIELQKLKKENAHLIKYNNSLELENQEIHKKYILTKDRLILTMNCVNKGEYIINKNQNEYIKQIKGKNNDYELENNICNKKAEHNINEKENHIKTPE